MKITIETESGSESLTFDENNHTHGVWKDVVTSWIVGTIGKHVWQQLYGTHANLAK